MLIREIIIENFMSYEYARVPFKQGVNVVCGPNGAGKSSILLAISVVLGQSYTERSRKLSDLIRWGKDQARITIVLDNSPLGSRRPAPKYDKDQIFLTRILRRDGEYWFELDGHAVSKAEVERLLARFSVDPDNMLIIMHQNMVEQFSVLSQQEKLRIVEAAVGLEPYRKNVLEAQKKLSRIMSQEESVNQLLENATQTLNYWREQYERFQQKKQLQLKRAFLERELAWTEAAKHEAIIRDIEAQIRRHHQEQNRIENEVGTLNQRVAQSQEQIRDLQTRLRGLLNTQIGLERQKAELQASVTFANQTIEEIQAWTHANQARIRECLNQLEQLENAVLRQQETGATRQPATFSSQLEEVKKAYKDLESAWTQQLTTKSRALKESYMDADTRIGELDEQIAQTRNTIDEQTGEMEKLQNHVVDGKIALAILNYQKETSQLELARLEKNLQAARLDFEEAVRKAEQKGQKMAATRPASEILEEIRTTDGHLAALADVSEDIERMYASYSRLYLELKEKARLVNENREKALEEVKTRMHAWKTVIQTLLERVNLQYQNILTQTQATGEVKLSNSEDIEDAGLEVTVGFKGAKPVPLNAYTQSGGERSTAIMSFLLALQQHVRSPFRAVDEFDIHMDPKNREVIARLLIASVKSMDTQYVTITPSQITFADSNIHMITVQNVEGTSMIREVV